MTEQDKGPAEPAEPAPDQPREPDRTPATPAPARSRPDPLRGSRTSAMWVAVGVLVLVLILLTVFILQNTQDVQVSFLGWEGEAPLAAVLLIAATSGLLLAVIAGTLRIWQLRRRVRREEH